jgi:hypothetical protein
MANEPSTPTNPGPSRAKITAPSGQGIVNKVPFSFPRLKSEAPTADGDLPFGNVTGQEVTEVLARVSDKESAVAADDALGRIPPFPAPPHAVRNSNSKSHAHKRALKVIMVSNEAQRATEVNPH